MFCDVFKKADAAKLLSDKKIWFMGSSNMRAIYKDLLWLLTKENLAPQEVFKTKNEPNYLSDTRLSHGLIHNGVNYVETRESKGDVYLFFNFLTRIYSDSLVKLIEKTKNSKNVPDVIFINSTIWDLSRYGSTENCIKKFKENLVKTFKFLTTELPNTRIIWKTCLPIDRTASGAIFIDEIKDVVPMVPWHILEANRYAAVTANFFNIDVLDFHHHMRLCGYHRVKDGIHWNSVAVRYLTNVFLTHLALCFEAKLPGVYDPSNLFLSETSSFKLEKKALEERIDKKKDFLSKLLSKAVKEIKKSNPIKKAKNIIKKKKNFYKVNDPRSNSREIDNRNTYNTYRSNYNLAWNNPTTNYNINYNYNIYPSTSFSQNSYGNQNPFGNFNPYNQNMHQINSYNNVQFPNSFGLSDPQIQMVCANYRCLF